MDEEDELMLQPFQDDQAHRKALLAEERLSRAKQLLKYEEICAEQEKARDLSIKDLGYQFGIRHIGVITMLFAGSLAVFLNLGIEAGIASSIIALILGALFFVHDWHVQFDADIRRRIREWKQEFQNSRFAGQ